MEYQQYGKRNNKAAVWVIVVVALLIITNLITFLVCTRLPYFAAAAKPGSGGGETTTTDPKVEKLLFLIGELRENYYFELDEDYMWEEIYKGLLAGTGDRYAEYLTAEEYEEYSVTLEGSYSGIGIQMSNDDEGNVLIVGVFNGSPAYGAGLQVGDIIVRADEESLLGKGATYAVSFIRGPEGSTVTLEILRDGETFTVDIVRDRIELVYVESRMLTDDIGYIYISEFETNTYEQFAQAVTELEAMGMKALVLDIRKNPGGLVSEAVQIADDLLPRCQVIYTVNARGERSSYDSDEYVRTDIPVTLLVDDYSASSSEILTVALKDNGRVTVIGITTYGKGIVQVLMPLSDGSMYKYTFAEYFGPNGTKIHEAGVEPDIIVELPEEYRNLDIHLVPFEYDYQLQKAIEYLEEEIGQ
ncbi:MAG: S41 family peptidase [Eubacteriaceae bacterium]|nr:S41 family peptidase [Eubacteriaceae bacterium]